MKITILPLNKTIEATYGENLHHIIISNGIHINGTCAGNRTCGKCKVIIGEGNNKDYTSEELKLLTENERSSGFRLACCFTITKDTSVTLLKDSDDIIYTKDETKITNASSNSEYGMAFDIGTTTVVATLWNLDTNEMVGSNSILNPQSIYGADVITRLAFANQSTLNRELLTNAIRDGINGLIQKLTNQTHINNKDIVSATIVANTTMTHLFLNKSVESLVRIPFQGVTYHSECLNGADLGIKIHPEGKIYVLPGIFGHVGADTVGCIIETNLAKTDGISLLVDIGTNGEIVLSKRGKITVCSTAAGPAFEGGNLYQGMRATIGAIHKVNIMDENIQVEFIGGENEEPLGICGSGAIECIAEMYKNHIVDSTGRLQGMAGEDNYLTLWQKDQKKIILTQKDIRELQLAKGAIYAGIMMLLKEENVAVNELNHIYLSGAFGSNLNLLKAIQIGLIPNVNLDKVKYIGNGAMNGAIRVLLGQISKEETERISREVKHFELALSDDFNDEFIEALSFPELD